MPKKLNEAELSELTELKGKAQSILEFLFSKYKDSPLFTQWNEMDDVIESEFNKKNLRGMRVINKELKDWVSDLPQDELCELRARGVEI